MPGGRTKRQKTQYKHEKNFILFWSNFNRFRLDRKQNHNPERMQNPGLKPKKATKTSHICET